MIQWMCRAASGSHARRASRTQYRSDLRGSGANPRILAQFPWPRSGIEDAASLLLRADLRTRSPLAVRRRMGRVTSVEETSNWRCCIGPGRYLPTRVARRTKSATTPPPAEEMPGNNLALLDRRPFVIPFIGFWIFLMNQVQGGGSKVMSFGKSRAKRMSVDSPKITFRDVAGVDEAVEELHEIKEFLENPKKFPGPGGSDSQGRPALWPARYR